jgi:ribose transport system ATP-binding protein
MVDSASVARLAASGISKSFAGTAALTNVDLELFDGEMLALVGANGAGKSTLVKIICGVLAPDAGSIAVDGKRVHFTAVGDALAAGIAVAHQQVSIIAQLTGAQNIMLGREPLRAGFIRERELLAHAQKLADRFGVELDLTRDCGTLGLGEKKILDILKALAHEPSILILDEPTASLTLNESRRLFGFLRDLKNQGLGILLISHHLNEVFDQCDRVVVLKDGAKVHDGPVAGISREALVQSMVGRTIETTDWTSHASTGSAAISVAESGRYSCPSCMSIAARS